MKIVGVIIGGLDTQFEQKISDRLIYYLIIYNSYFLQIKKTHKIRLGGKKK